MDDELEDVPTAQLDAQPPASPSLVVGDAAPVSKVVAAPESVVAAAEPSAKPVVAAPQVASTSAEGDETPVANSSIARPEPLVPVPEPVPAPAPPAPVSIERDISSGSLLCHRYVLGRLLGSGGGAFIFQAEDRRRIGAEDFGNRIAIKVLRPEVRRNPHALTRLKREFRQMQRLAHPGIARVFELACDEDVWFMTMELIDGQTINRWLKTQPSRAQALQVISACCDALAHAHDVGIVHGDLKPSNVLVLADGRVKLVDFGSAAERDATTGEIEKDRSFAATPPYASPQILAGDIADPRDDVFSLACLAYGILTHGEHPFERLSSTEARSAGMRPTYTRTLQPREFDVIVRGLSWEREQRPASVHEFLHALLASDLRRDTGARDVQPTSIDIPSRPVTSSAPREMKSAAAAASPNTGVRENAAAVNSRTQSAAELHASGADPSPSGLGRAEVDAKDVSSRPNTPPKRPESRGDNEGLRNADRAPRPADPVATPNKSAKASDAGSIASGFAPPAGESSPGPPRDPIRAEDIARLKAALAAAEDHAERLERGTPSREKPTDVEKADALARFRGYVAGPMAPAFEEPSPEGDLNAPDVAQQAQEPPKKSKRLWPWQRNALFAAVFVIAASALAVKQFDFSPEPIQHAVARPAPAPAAVVEAPAAPTPVAAIPDVAPAIAEKKSPPDVAKPKAPPATSGKVSFATRTLQIGAGQTIAALTVKRTQSQRGRAQVPWTIEAGTARPGVDYILAESPIIQFLDGQEVRSLFIKLIPDRDPHRARNSKTFTVKLRPSANGPSLGDINKVYVTIVGDIDIPRVAEAAVDDTTAAKL